MVGACAGMAAGVILVGLWGAFAGIPYILNHPGPNNNPVIMVLSGFVMYALYLGLPLGAPIGAIVGLVAGGIRGACTGTATSRKPAISFEDLDTGPETTKAVESRRSPSSRRRRGSPLVIALAIPGAVILVWSIYGWWERSRFDRFAAEVKRLGGRAENAEIEGWSIAVSAIDLDLSLTATDDADLERLARDPIFDRLNSLSLAGTRITDKGVALLDEHPYLSDLNLSRTSVTDRGLASIPRCCPNSLNLSGTRVTDATIRVLEQQAKLSPNRNIDLTDTQVTEQSVKDLAKANWMMYITYGDSKSPKHSR